VCVCVYVREWSSAAAVGEKSAVMRRERRVLVRRSHRAA